MAGIPEYDVVIAGAGFGCVAMMYRLRKMGISMKVFEKGSDFGGIWYWNCYPGARVDSDAPIYQLFDKELWEGWTFSERYPSWKELREYFHYLDKKLNLTKDIEFDAAVEHAEFDESRHQWLIKAANGSQAYARTFVPAIGFASKKYVPPYPGLEKFKGVVEHTATWPQGGVDLKGKRIAVIGTGASGVQTSQEVAKDAKHLTVFQRTPNFACPMNQRKLTEAEVKKRKDNGEFEKAFEATFSTFAGFTYDFLDKNTFDDSPEERKALYENLLIKEGGFRFWLNTYKDMLFDEKANTEAYNFWRDFTRSRINDERKKNILAPMKPPHPWGTKRPSLEQYYYEIFNYPHVELVDLGEDPITEITETGIKTKSGQFDCEVDVIALATGFDAVTGSLAQMDIRGTDGKPIAEHWKDGLKTAYGMSCEKFPNMFFLYGPQAPTAFSNGPSCVQVQANWAAPLIAKLKAEGITRFEAKPETEKMWTDKTWELWNASLFPQTKSWYSGANIPGKRVEPLNFPGGFPLYIKSLNESLDNNYQAWTTAKA